MLRGNDINTKGAGFMSDKNREVLKVEINGKEVEVAVLRPSHKQQKEAENVYMRRYRELVETGDCLLRVQLDKVMRDRNLWDDSKEKEYAELQQKLIKGSKRLAEGGFKKTEAYKLAIQMRKDRSRMVDLISVRNTLDINTAEAQAENYRFHYLVSACAVYSTNDDFLFASLEDYLAKADEPYAIKVANSLFKLMHNLDLVESQKKLPENKFLKRFGYVNDQLQLVDVKGRLVNEDGKHIDENGRYIRWVDDMKFVFVDLNDNEVDENGDFVVDAKPFLDDDDAPITE